MRADSPDLLKGAKAMFNDSDRNKLNALSRRIDEARKASDPVKQSEQGGLGPRSRGLVRAVRIGSDFVALIMGMALFGWLADRHFGTAPWVMLVAISLGFVASFWILVRAVMNNNTPDQRSEAGDQEEK